jgi:cellobiose phosphorylase
VTDGTFSEDGQSFIIPRPDTGNPLVNVISTGDYGVALAQTGAGCSWGRRPAEPVTEGAGRFARNAGGRSLYIRDDKTGRAWSAGWQPLRARPDSYECIHGVGHTLITSHTEGLQAQWLTFVPFEEPLEIWRVRLRNLSKKTRTLSLWTGIEWASALSTTNDETTFVQDGGRILLANAKASTAGGWGSVYFHAVNRPTRAHALDRRALWGLYGSSEDPEALKKGRYLPQAAPAGDPFASFCVPFTLKPGEERSVLFTVGRADSQSEALLKARKFQDFAQMDHAWNRTQLFWDRYLSAFTVETPDKGFNALVNTWLKYQALSQGLWGGRGPRDTRIFLPLEPERVRKEILARAGQERDAAASVSFGDVPWPLLLPDYLRETGDGALLGEKLSSRHTVYDAATRALRELAALPPEEGAGAEFLSEWSDMVLWAAESKHLPPREKAVARKWKGEAARRRSPSSRNGRGAARELPAVFRGAEWAEALFSPGGREDAPTPAALFRTLTEDVLGIKPLWNGLRVKPSLPAGWKSASARREYRGALYLFRFIRKPGKPAGFMEIVFNGERVPGNVLPVPFERKNEVVVTLGRAA